MFRCKARCKSANKDGLCRARGPEQNIFAPSVLGLNAEMFRETFLVIAGSVLVRCRAVSSPEVG